MNFFKKKNDSYSIYPSIEKIDGWLNKPAAYATVDILEWQFEKDIKGGLLEIGVFCGKYFAILTQSALRQQSPILGIDTFQFAPEQRVIDELQVIFGKGIAEKIILLKSASEAISASDVEKLVGNCRFISIDGSHEYESVFLDLILSEQVISCAGLIAVDDFLNPLTLGVNRAVNQFLATPRRLQPVAYTANKLFLAHRSSAPRYREAFEAIFEQGEEPFEVNFRKKRKLGRHHIEQDLYGSLVLVR